MRRPIALSLTLLLVACGTTEVVKHTSATNALGPAFQHANGELTFTTVLDGENRSVVLTPEEGAPAEGPVTYRIRVVRPSPRGAIEPASIRWVFARLGTETDVLTPDGIRLEHPDRAARRTLITELDVAGIEGTLERLPALLRADARGEVFAALCQQDLPPGTVRTLTAAVAPGGALAAPTFEGIPVEMSLTTRSKALEALAKIPGLTAAEADGLARLAPTIGYDSYERRLLCALVRETPVTIGAFLKAAEGIGSISDRYDVLEALVDRDGLTAREADRVAAAARGIGYDSYERKLLGRLVSKRSPSTQAVLDAASQIGAISDRHAVLMSLVERRPDRSDAERIARAAPGIGYDSYEKTILVKLVKTASPSVQVVLECAASIGSISDRRDVLVALARLPGLSLEDSNRIAAATPKIGYDSYEQEVLLILLKSAQPTTSAILGATRTIRSITHRRDVLLALTRRRADRDAEAIAQATPSIGYDRYEKEVLVALAKRGVTHPVLKASTSIGSIGDHRDVLLALVGQEGLSEAMANSVADHAPQIGYDDYEKDVLVALVQRARPSTGAVLNAVRSVKSIGPHRDVLIALAKRPQLSTAEANLIARATRHIGHDPYEAEVLLALSRKADASAIKHGLRYIGSHSARLKVLEALLD